MTQFNFISGLPRAGSTLLSAILLQNPRFHAGMSSPVASLFSSVLAQCSAGSEFSSMIDTSARRRLLRGIFDSYYADKADKAVVFDTSRGWTSRLPALMEMFPQAKVIACVRNVAWVMDSIERVYRKNPFENTKLFVDDTERNTVYSRVETLAQRNRLVGFAWASLKEAYYGEHANSLLLIDYDLLSQAPERVLRLVYEFIGEPWFEHDFDNLSYDAPQFDDALGVSGLHKVKPRVAFEPRQTILPPDLFEQYSNLSFWNDGSPSAANVIRMKSDAAGN
ncbi:sulfotransferase [Pseudomonas sp. DTU_2021_1001937_2_SI_NGA_ILE_001]|uniref:sulfotransferase family protein n=1 Tax=Pseudomonas sp. DTU_2021_1001937_2_SI_NGA_ILE_001 TaxID=3077589 RepID=UPI0028FC332A|nr:sulfotransferase [Pseudomonas sp. DTU_2021_1001937_2_SI_NGA_ILE_001]WNW12303.1 sulfotransferase [Pseudomonas sp. DTU_2021_1001937_2_SI_NGA_ILE_001]